MYLFKPSALRAIVMLFTFVISNYIDSEVLCSEQFDLFIIPSNVINVSITKGVEAPSKCHIPGTHCANRDLWINAFSEDLGQPANSRNAPSLH